MYHVISVYDTWYLSLVWWSCWWDFLNGPESKLLDSILDRPEKTFCITVNSKFESSKIKRPDKTFDNPDGPTFSGLPKCYQSTINYTIIMMCEICMSCIVNDCKTPEVLSFQQSERSYLRIKLLIQSGWVAIPTMIPTMKNPEKIEKLLSKTYCLHGFKLVKPMVKGTLLVGVNKKIL